jgi:hypothetical protein
MCCVRSIFANVKVSRKLLAKETMMGTMSINMQQFRAKFNVTSDNVVMFEKIMATSGKFFTLDARPYVEELGLFGIFYTLTQ